MAEVITKDALLTNRIPRLYMHYLIPTLIGMASNSLYCLADVFFISKGAGSTGLAALNIAMPLFTLYSAIGLSFGVGGATIMSIAEGKAHAKERNQAFSASIIGMTLLGLIIALFGTVFLEPFAYALGSSSELLPMVKEYMLPINACAFLFVLNYALGILLRNDHAPKLAMKATLAGNLSNIVLDYIFVMVWKMGMFGAALATSISAGLTVLFMLLHFVMKKNTVHFDRHCFVIAIWKRMITNGIGSGILEISAGIVILVFNYVILQVSDQLFLAAFAIVTNVAYVVKGLLNGFAQAAQPIISMNHGARQVERVRHAFHISMWFSCIFAIVLYMIFFLFPESVAAIFANNETNLITLAAQGIRYYFTSLLFMAGVTMFLYYFQAVELGKAATILALLKGVVFILLALYGLLALFGIQGIWFAVTLAEGMAFVTGYFILRKRQSL